MCGRAGLAAYEVSNHARPGAECRHNLVYWRYGDYAGVGPGAHGRLTCGGRFATEALRGPEDWLAAVERTGSGIARRTALTGPEQATEMLMMGLRLAEGIDMRRFAALAGAPLDGHALAELAGLGLVEPTGERLAVTAAGRPVLNAILERLVPAVGVAA
jgi:oxygen-independent coproporphyrinogen-3 oxidase